jgi:hypothetical protein
MVVRIMLMVPIYAISSLVALFSLDAAFVIDAIRDIYEVYHHLAAQMKLETHKSYYPKGIRHLLLFPTASSISWRREVASHSVIRPTTQTPSIPRHDFQARNGPFRSVHLLISEARHPS